MAWGGWKTAHKINVRPSKYISPTLTKPDNGRLNHITENNWQDGGRLSRQNGSNK